MAGPSKSVTAIRALLKYGDREEVPWNLIVYTVPGAVVGGQVGSRVFGSVSSEKMKRLISLIFGIIGIEFLVTSLRALST